jgi:CheY-like chemotaxis protein
VIRLVLADDMPAVREVIRLGLQGAPGRFDVVGEAGDGESALASIANLAPDVAILDVEMPGLTGLEVVSRLREQGVTTPVILCTSSEPDLPVPLPAGVVARLSKPFPLERLVQAVEDAASTLTEHH